MTEAQARERAARRTAAGYPTGVRRRGSSWRTQSTAPRTITPEELELADYLVSNNHRMNEPVTVYTLLLADGAAYVGTSNNHGRRFKRHAANGEIDPPGPDPATPLDLIAPSVHYLSIHGAPSMVKAEIFPSRAHAVIAEAKLTDRVAAAGIHVFGSGWAALECTRFERNEFPGRKTDAAELQTIIS